MAKHTDNPEEGDNINEGNNGDDNFGLPDLDYKPLDSNEETSATTTSYTGEETVSENTHSEQNYSYIPEEEPKSNAPIIIAVIIGLVLLVAGFLIYQYVYKPKAEKAKMEEQAKQEAERKQRQEEEARLAKEKEEAERKRLEAEKTVVVETPSIGTIETLNARTGRYHVVISSDVDDDLIMDYAKKLSKDGTSTMIIPPFGKKKFYRLVMGSYDSFAEAQSSADGVKPKYGDAVWVIKY